MTSTVARVSIALTAAAVTLLAPGCSAPMTTDEKTYRVDQPIDSLTVEARAAGVTIETGTGPPTVTESYRYSGNRPTTSHRVDGANLTLTESGCGDDDARCETRYRIRVPAETAIRVEAQAGAVTLTGPAGPVDVTTQAGAVQATAITGDRITVRTKAGATELDFAEPPLAVVTETDLGAVHLRVPREAAYAVSVGTDVGRSDIRVRQDAASEHRIDVRTRVGAVRIEPGP